MEQSCAKKTREKDVIQSSEIQQAGQLVLLEKPRQPHFVLGKLVLLEYFKTEALLSKLQIT
jgi:hypothetical protein